MSQSHDHPWCPNSPKCVISNRMPLYTLECPVHKSLQQVKCVRSAIQLVVSMLAAVAQSVAVDTNTALPITDSPAMTMDRATDAITDEHIVATLTVLRELLITHMVVDRQIWYQKSYLGTTFNVPKPNTAISFYLITCGHRVGIFSSLCVLLLWLSAFLLLILWQAIC